mmetsp:Transcript_102694/g.229358  ORF Transcript_102694/g.229358 Transcript_102694/m.229358 type:complete len:274 (-) Transcript_102694:983-1804(-)
MAVCFSRVEASSALACASASLTCPTSSWSDSRCCTSAANNASSLARCPRNSSISRVRPSFAALQSSAAAPPRSASEHPRLSRARSSAAGRSFMVELCKAAASPVASRRRPCIAIEVSTSSAQRSAIAATSPCCPSARSWTVRSCCTNGACARTPSRAPSASSLSAWPGASSSAPLVARANNFSASEAPPMTLFTRPLRISCSVCNCSPLTSAASWWAACTALVSSAKAFAQLLLLAETSAKAASRAAQAWRAWTFAAEASSRWSVSRSARSSA